jgi:DNA invertase Pin-like site-specific DNA recombinase
MAAAHRGAFDAVVGWRIDLCARRGKQLVLALEEFRALGAHFIPARGPGHLDANGQSNVRHSRFFG